MTRSRHINRSRAGKRQRREEAQTRQEDRDKRSNVDQMEKLAARGAMGCKEYNRLWKEMEGTKE